MRPRILVVEDEPGIADTIAYALATDGFEPVWRATGEAALQEAAAGELALMILDVGLPDINGFDLFKRLSALTSAPAIFLTARSAEIDRVVGLELGADDYIGKPFSPRELVARVRSVLRRLARSAAQPPPSADTVSPSGQTPFAQAPRGPARDPVPQAPHRVPRIPFNIDDERRTITYFGQPLDLSRYEYRVLKLLVSRPGRVFSRDEILQHAWDEPQASFDRTVDAHIKQLRAKLKQVAPQAEAIRTHRGEGYSLSEHW
jgi:two-component system catabolic regulation response regulator CreB